MKAGSSRNVVLERVRAATRDSALTPAQAASVYVRHGSMSAEARLELMAERLREYDATVVECRPEGLVAAIQAQLTASGRRTFVAPAGLPAEWLAPGFNWKIDGDLPVDEIERADGVVTACSCAVAESGTIVLHHGPAEGRRVISLLPDWHLCVVHGSQVVETLPEYFDRCAIRDRRTGIRDRKAGTEGLGTRDAEVPGSGTEGGNLPALATWISGPSATADIEMTRIKGVHGPRFLNVVLVSKAATKD